MESLIGSASYMPHGYCLFWNPWLVSTHAASDILIAGAYFAIPVAIYSFVRRRRDLEFSYVGWLFAAFILLCGITHVFGLLTLWFPVYDLQAAAKVMTALVSAATAVIVFPLIPKLLAIPSPAHLERANSDLAVLIGEHERTLEQLRRTKAELKQRVDARTAELADANARLTVVARELVHRSKNMLTVVRGLASQTARTSADKTDLVEKLSGRLRSLADSLDAVTQAGDLGMVDLEMLISGQLAHYQASFGSRVSFKGPRVALRASIAQQVGLAIHELATNAVKYGALSNETGAVRIGWRVEQDTLPDSDGASASDSTSTSTSDGAGASVGARDILQIEWREWGAPTDGAGPSAAAENHLPSGETDKAAGFGTRLLDWAVPAAVSGSAERTLERTGLLYRLRIPIPDEAEPAANAEEEILSAAFI